MRERAINRIALLIILIAMAAGLFSPAACDDFYNKLQGLNNQATELHAITERSQHECIIDESAAHHSINCDIQRVARTLSFSGAAILGRADDSVLPSYTHLFEGLISAPPLGLLLRQSVFFTFYIHLTDGQK